LFIKGEGKMGNVRIAGHGITVSSSIHDHVLDTLRSILRHLRDVPRVNVVLSCEKNRRDLHRAVVNTRLKGNDLSVSCEGDDMYLVIAKTMTKLSTSIEALKDKHRRVYRKPSHKRLVFEMSSK
jgi:ribosomal subunit interface protein